jgi:hypothetical protein
MPIRTVPLEIDYVLTFALICYLVHFAYVIVLAVPEGYYLPATNFVQVVSRSSYVMAAERHDREALLSCFGLINSCHANRRLIGRSRDECGEVLVGAC